LRKTEQVFAGFWVGTAGTRQIGLAFRKNAVLVSTMPSDSPTAPVLEPEIPAPVRPGLLELFLAFAKMSLAGFGGVLVWARRGIVEQHRWMTAEEFNETFALCHFLPGPNIVNLSVVFGARFGGIWGSLAAFVRRSMPATVRSRRCGESWPGCPAQPSGC
jgi:chromate transporter